VTTSSKPTYVDCLALCCWNVTVTVDSELSKCEMMNLGKMLMIQAVTNVRDSSEEVGRENDQSPVLQHKFILIFSH